MDLYRRLLADCWDGLPQSLRDAHAVPLNASGSMEVVRGKGRLANWIADLTRLPKAGERRRVVLQVSPSGETARWQRSFDEEQYPPSLQSARGGMLLERCGPIRLGFELAHEDGSLVYRQRRFWLLGCPLPMALAIRVSATVSAAREGWWVEVVVTAPLVGLLCRYAGNMRPI